MIYLASDDTNRLGGHAGHREKRPCHFQGMLPPVSGLRLYPVPAG